MARVVALLAVLALTAAACGDDDDPDAASETTVAAGPSVAITSPASGTEVSGNTVTLDFDVQGLSIVRADGDTSGRTGHLHLFIDQEPVAPGATIERAPGIVHTTDDPLLVTGLSVGEHTLTVVLGDGAHARIGDAEDSVTVTVEGPSVDASAPATLAAGQPLAIDVDVEGLQLVAADGDTSGRTGHLHAIVDRDPTRYGGQPIPTGDPTIVHSATSPITVTGLTPGEHTIWIVAGNGAHVPLAPPVMDKVTVTVS